MQKSLIIMAKDNLPRNKDISGSTTAAGFSRDGSPKDVGLIPYSGCRDINASGVQVGWGRGGSFKDVEYIVREFV